jgi:hypothetical protein
VLIQSMEPGEHSTASGCVARPDRTAPDPSSHTHRDSAVTPGS